ncbi:hypothetical protein LIER_01756 [Lithospermum erythrorhizon]|uniref:Uncharacterized protein n=1 Tax=Lithospermum erythrorhizon TaxID=34254 RepID=A0AAV3NM68_LITER
MPIFFLITNCPPDLPIIITHNQARFLRPQPNSCATNWTTWHFHEPRINTTDMKKVPTRWQVDHRDGGGGGSAAAEGGGDEEEMEEDEGGEAEEEEEEGDDACHDNAFEQEHDKFSWVCVCFGEVKVVLMRNLIILEVVVVVV